MFIYQINCMQHMLAIVSLYSGCLMTMALLTIVLSVQVFLHLVAQRCAYSQMDAQLAVCLAWATP